MSARAREVVIAFPPARPRPEQAQARGPAEIVIFPGVRIERLGEAEPKRPLPRKKRASTGEAPAAEAGCY